MVRAEKKSRKDTEKYYFMCIVNKAVKNKLWSQSVVITGQFSLKIICVWKFIVTANLS